jgi:hypothetical protein
MGIKFSHRIVDEWIEMFENGRTIVVDAERSGHPATAMTTRNSLHSSHFMLLFIQWVLM